MEVLKQIFTLCGGLAFFLYGMNIMSSGLEKMAGGKLEVMLRKMTSNPFKSLSLGAGITVAIQSSSAMTVMLVGLVNSGIMTLQQTIGVIMGSNIGTTSTAWIMSLSGIDNKGPWYFQILNPEVFSPVIALVGIIMIMMAKSDKKKSIGSVLVGFAILMTGMDLMGNVGSYLRSLPGFDSILTQFNNPFLGVLVGAVFTGIIQSSAASLSILMSVAGTSLTYGMAIPIIMGLNIGTCVTALISSVGVTRNAKRVAIVHITFNCIGTVVVLSLYYIVKAIVGVPFHDVSVPMWGIALVHTVFNVSGTALLMPFSHQLEKFAYLVIRDDKEQTEETYSFIDSRLLATPSVAIAECDRKTAHMARIAKETLMKAIGLLNNYDQEVADQVVKDEDELDLYEDKLGTVLVQISRSAISDDDSKRVAKQLHTIGDFERIGDHAVNLLMAAREIYEKNVHFSSDAVEELKIATDAITEIVGLTVESFRHEDLTLAAKVEPLEQVIDQLISDMKARHIERLQTGKCTIQLGFILSDILNNYERISDHCSNIAVALIETRENAYEAHEYLNGIKQAGDPEFETAYLSFRQKYNLR